MNYYFVEPREDELYHYGVRGMKWGVRKQQPISVGRRRLSQQMSLEQQKVARRAKIKKAAKVGAVVAGAALATYGVYKLHNIRMDNMAAVQRYFNTTTWNAHKSTYASRPNHPGYTIKANRYVSFSKNRLLGPQVKETVISKYSGGKSGTDTSTRYIGRGGSKFIGSKDIRNDLAWDYIGRNSRLGGTAYNVRYKLKGR